MAKRTCLFCSRTDLTNEHIWPDWFGRWFQGTHPQGMFLLSGDFRGDSSVRRDLNFRHKVVCGNPGCNDRWMSRLQNSARSVLVPILETPTDLNTPHMPFLPAIKAFSPPG